MYCKLVKHQIVFKEDQFKQDLGDRDNRILRLLHLTQKQVVLFMNDCWIYRIDLATIKVISGQKLEGRVFDAVALKDGRVIAMLAEKKSLVQIDLTTTKVTEIYKTSQQSQLNSKKQASHFFQSKLYLFNNSSSYYLQKNLAEERKIDIIYFPQCNEQHNIQQKYLIHSFQYRDFHNCKLDELYSITRFKQNPQKNGIFKFQQINLKTFKKIQHIIIHSSFISYSTIIDIKKINQYNYIICLNGKNSSNDFILYDKIQNTTQIIHKSQNIINKCILINQKYQVAIFSFFYGRLNATEIIKIINLHNGQVLDQFEIKIDQVVVEKAQTYFLQYGNIRKFQEKTQFNLYALVDKSTHYFKIMENLHIDSKFGTEFIAEVNRLLLK